MRIFRETAYKYEPTNPSKAVTCHTIGYRIESVSSSENFPSSCKTDEILKKKFNFHIIFIFFNCHTLFRHNTEDKQVCNVKRTCDGNRCQHRCGGGL